VKGGSKILNRSHPVKRDNALMPQAVRRDRGGQAEPAGNGCAKPCSVSGVLQPLLGGRLASFVAPAPVLTGRFQRCEFIDTGKDDTEQ